jgi:hypothetical protein
MTLTLRKTVIYVDETLIEGGRAAARPLKLFAAAAVLRNSWAGRDFVEDLKPEIRETAPIGKRLTEEILRIAGSCDAVEGYGKAAAKRYLSFTNTRGGPNCPVVIRMRSRYLTIQFAISDAPAPDEIVVALGASIGGRPHHRIGDRYQDLKELGGTDV